MAVVCIRRKRQTDPCVEGEAVVSELNLSPLRRRIQLIVINARSFIALKPHGHMFFIRTKRHRRNSLAVISPSIVRLGLLFLFGIINDPVVASDIKHAVRGH